MFNNLLKFTRIKERVSTSFKYFWGGPPDPLPVYTPQITNASDPLKQPDVRTIMEFYVYSYSTH